MPDIVRTPFESRTEAGRLLGAQVRELPMTPERVWATGAGA